MWKKIKPILRNPIITTYSLKEKPDIQLPIAGTMALAHYLASLTANVLVGSVQKGEIAWEKYNKILKHAKVLNAYECGENLYDDTTYLDSRG